MTWRLLALLVRLGLGLLLVYLSLALVIDLLRTPAFQQLMVCLSFVVGGLWWCYSRLPDWLQELIRCLWKWNETRDE